MTLQTSPSPAVCAQPSRMRRVLRWLVVVLITAAFPITVAWLLFLTFWDVAEINYSSWGWDGKPRFVETVYPRMIAPLNSTPWQRIQVAYLDFQQRYGRKNLAKSSFPAGSEEPCYVHPYLTQCMSFTGTKYLIAEEVSCVDFGHTNVLNAAEWVAAFEIALQTNQPVCWNPASNHTWKENLLLIRERPRQVKVIPPSRLADYQKAGLVSPSFVAPQTSSHPR